MKKKLKRLAKMCKKVCKALDLTYRRKYYAVLNKEDSDEDTAAECVTDCEGDSIMIRFHDGFFDEPKAYQLRIVIHEHIHVLTSPLEQLWRTHRRHMPKTQRRCYEDARILLDEDFTCKLESIIGRLL